MPSDAPTATRTLIELARVLSGPVEPVEALRRVCRELARFTGAETVSAHLVNVDDRVLLPVAAYRVPKEALPTLMATPLPIDAQGFRDSVFAAARVTWSDHVPTDPRFASPLFRTFPHQSGIIIPLRIDEGVVGALYLVWWTDSRQPSADELDVLDAVGQQVGLLLRAAALLRDAEQRHRRAETAEQRYRTLVENVPVGVFRTTAAGTIVDVNTTLVELLRYPDRDTLLRTNAPAVYVDPGDRHRFQRDVDAQGMVRDFDVQLRRHDGQPLWVRLNARAVRDGDGVFYDGIVQDITSQRRVEAAERQAEALRAVAHLANAAAHEINNPLVVIVGRIELLRKRLAATEGLSKHLDEAVAAAKRIADIVAHMGRITRLEVTGAVPTSLMLDLRRSTQPAPSDAAAPELPATDASAS